MSPILVSFAWQYGPYILTAAVTAIGTHFIKNSKSNKVKKNLSLIMDTLTAIVTGIQAAKTVALPNVSGVEQVKAVEIVTNAIGTAMEKHPRDTEELKSVVTEIKATLPK